MRARRYALTVIDCGTLARDADQIALASATHVAWVLPATAGAASRGRQLLDAIAPHQSGRELIVARHERATAEGAAARAATDRGRATGAPCWSCSRTCPSSPRQRRRGAETAQVPVQAILGALRR